MSTSSLRSMLAAKSAPQSREEMDAFLQTSTEPKTSTECVSCIAPCVSPINISQAGAACNGPARFPTLRREVWFPASRCLFLTGPGAQERLQAEAITALCERLILGARAEMALETEKGTLVRSGEPTWLDVLESRLWQITGSQVPLAAPRTWFGGGRKWLRMKVENGKRWTSL